MDWLNRARQFVGNLFGGAQRTIGQISGNVARAVGQAEQQAARTAQQVVRQIPQPPRIQLPQIPQVQMPRFQAPRVQLPQAPKIDLAAVGQALRGFQQGVDISGRTFTGKALTPEQQRLVAQIPGGRTMLAATPRASEIGQFLRSTAPGIDLGLAIKEKGLGAFSPQAIMQRGPVAGVSQLVQKASERVATTPEAARLRQMPGITGELARYQQLQATKPSEAIKQPLVGGFKAAEQLPGFKQLGQTEAGKFIRENVAKPILQAYIDTAGRVGGAQFGEKTYAEGLKGYSQLASDITNVASIAYTGGLSAQLAKGGIRTFIPTAIKLAPRLAASGAGQNIIAQLAEGKKLNELDPREIALAAGAYTALGIGIPAATKVGGAAIRKTIGAVTPTAQAAKVGQALPTDKNALVIARSIPEKGALRAQGYTNVQVQFQPKPGQVIPTMRSTIPETAPKAPKGQEALFAEARKYKSADEFVNAQGTPVYHGTPNNNFKSFDNSNVGSYSGTESAKIGTWFTSNRDVADKFTYDSIYINNPKTKNGRIIEAYPKLDNPKIYNKAVDISVYQKAVSDIESQIKQLEAQRKSAPDWNTEKQIYKQIANLEENILPRAKALVNQLKRDSGDPFKIFESEVAKYGSPEKYVEALKKEGFDGVVIKGTSYDAEKGVNDQIAVFDPSQIKTKSQLTDIWNKANKPTLPSKPIFETVPESAMRPKGPKGVKERGFVTTVKESPQTEAATLTILKQADGSYKVKPNRILEKQANERIASNVADAKTYAMTQTDDQAVATAGQLIKYFQAKGDYGQAAEVASQAAKTLTEAGRAIQAATLYNKLNPEGILQYASSKMQKVGKKLDAESAEILTDMAKKIEAMPDGEAKQIAIKELLDEVGRTQGSLLPDKIITLWKAGLLTSPITTAGNLTSNTIKQVVKKAADDPIAALVDMTLGLATGKRTKTFTLRGEAAGAVEGLKRGGKYFKTGYDPRDPISKLDQKDVYFGKGFLGKIAKGYTDTVFRSLGAQDQPYFYAALKNTLYDQALAAAKTQGVKGAAKDKFIKNFVNNPDSKILDQATEEARTAVFQNKTFLGDIASRITQSNNPTVRTLGQFIMPFSRVPSAVATEIFERTPLGAAKEIVKQISKKSYDQRALSTAISKSTTGTLGLMGLGYALDRSGSINLAMPTSQAEQNLWQQEGRQPFSVKIGDKYYSMNYIQPFGSLIAMGAQYNRSLREGGSQQDALSAAFAMGAKSVTEQSFLRGVSGALGALQDPGRYAERFVEQTAGSVVPNIVRTTARAFDPLQREITSAGEAVLAGIPGLRETLQPKVDIFGKPIARPAGPIDTLFNPLRPTTAKVTPELQEVRRLFDVDKNVIPSEIDKNAFGKENPINQQQINELKTAMGNAVLNRYQQILADPRYGQLSDDQKAKALKDAKDAVIQGEKFRFAKTYDLPYTTADKLDKDTRDYLMGVTKDTIAATLPKPPKVKVSKARKARGTGRGRVARARISLKTPRLRRISISVPKARKISFKQPTPTKARKSIKIKTG